MNTRISMLLIASLSILLPACRNNRQYSDIVKETYFHKYGTPVTLKDWYSQGQDGQVIRLRKDGVTVTTSYDKGTEHGTTTYSFANSSTIEKVEKYVQGVLISKKENYPSGVPMKEEIYENNQLVQLKQWYEDGTPQAIESYEATFLQNGEYHNLLNVIESKVTDGRGTRTIRSNVGDLLYRDNIQNGQLIERIVYYPNGDPSAVISYNDGVEHGTRLTFLQGGLPNTVEQWEHGVQNGITVVYQNGIKSAEVPYVQGHKHGVELRFRDGTLLVEEVTWRNDTMHGQRKLYVDGVPTTEWYHEGEVVSRTTFERLNVPRKIS